eukprot:g22641.t1
MALRLRYRQSLRSVPIPAAAREAAEARYAALQAERAYLRRLWSPSQWDAICHAFEADFTFVSHPDLSAVFRIRRRIQGRCVEVSVPVGLCLRATVLLESFLLDHPAATTVAVRTYLRDVTLVGDARCPAIRYRRHFYLLPAALVHSGLDALFAAVAASPPVRDSLLPVPDFRVLWQALQTQAQLPPPTSLFRLRLQHFSCHVRPSCALDAALALAPLQALSSDSDISGPWHAFSLSWDASSSTSGHLFDPAAHSYASAPAAAAPRIFDGDSSRPLAPPSPPEPSAAWLCRFCSRSFSDQALFEDHLRRTHDCSLTAYPSLLRTALGHSFPRPADPLVLRHILARFRSAAHAAWSTPLQVCACCATTPSDPSPLPYNLRTPAFDLPALHDFLSAHGYVQRYRARLPASLPDSFLGLTFPDLADHSLPAPALPTLQHSFDDRWLLFLADPSAREAWIAACHDSTLPLSVPLCLPCAAALQGPRASMPSRALANDNVHVPLPSDLRDLTPAEILFISRGFTLCRLITLPCRGPPQARQQALLGNVISFPQNSATLVPFLPRSLATVAEHVTVFFPADDAASLRHAPEFVVRRARVHAAILWLQAHNPFYADVLVDDAALAALPEDGIPLPLLTAARPLPEASIGAEPGPSEATFAPPAAAPAPHALSAAVLDVEGEATHPLALWQRCLLAVDDACQTLSTAPADAVLAAASADRVALAAGALLDAPVPAVDALPAAAAAPATTCFVVPHGSSPLSAFDESYWTLCFPHLFPFGEATERSPRIVRIQDRLWFRSLLLRADRSSASFPWRLDHSFAAVSFAVLHRRALMRAVHAKLSAPGFRRVLSDLQALRAVDFRRVYDVLGEHGGIPQALRHDGVSAAMKNLLGALRLVTGSVPCTDAARSIMRHELTALQIFFGLPTLFLTFNPCDTRHPFTAAFHHPNSNSLSPLPLPSGDDALFAALQQLDLPTLVASDPVAATRAFHLHVSLFLAELLGHSLPTARPSSPRTVEGIFGHVDAFYGVLLQDTWAIPLLSGARLPDPVGDPERFALLALLLLKPWSDATLRDLLAPASVSEPSFATWSAALRAFESSLQAILGPAASTHRAPPFSAQYWAQRSVDVLLHLRNISSGHFQDPNAAAVRSNPDAAAGYSGSVELPQPGVSDAPSSCSDDDIDVASLDGAAFDEPDPLPAGHPTSACTNFLSWQDIHDACHGLHAAADRYSSHFRSHATFAFPLASAPPAAADQPAVSSALPVAALLHTETDWASAIASSVPYLSAPSPSSSSLSPAHTSPLDTVAAWVQQGRCNQPDGRLNLKQAAMLCLHALWLHDFTIHRRSLLATSPPRQSSILLGGPGTGKSYILHLLNDLNSRYLPDATKICALMHTAARLVRGRTLHSALSIPFEPLHAKNKSLGDKKEELLASWAPIRSLLLDEISTIPSEVLGVAEFRCCQVKNEPFRSWGGVSVHACGDFLQLPPVKATSLATDVEPPPLLASDARRQVPPTSRDELSRQFLPPVAALLSRLISLSAYTLQHTKRRLFRYRCSPLT